MTILIEVLIRAKKFIRDTFPNMQGIYARKQRIFLASLHIAKRQLAYTRRGLSQARRYFLQALIIDFRVVCTGQNLALLFKSFLKPELLDNLRRLN